MTGRKKIQLNLAGQICPSCLIQTLKVLNDNTEDLRQGGSEIVVRTDHRDATRTVPETVMSMGYSVTVNKNDGIYEITIYKEK